MRKNFVEKPKTQTGLYSLKVKRRGFYKLQKAKSVPIRQAMGGAKGAALPVLNLGA